MNWLPILTSSCFLVSLAISANKDNSDEIQSDLPILSNDNDNERKVMMEMGDVSNPTVISMSQSSSTPLPPPLNDPINGPDIILREGFWSSFLTALMIILVSEFGDKTFLIAAILAMRHSRVVVLCGAMFALALMTVISAIFGMLLPNLIPRQYTLWLTSLLFAIFGVKMLIDARGMSSTRIREEYDGINHEIEDLEDRQYQNFRRSTTTINETTTQPPNLKSLRGLELGDPASDTESDSNCCNQVQESIHSFAHKILLCLPQKLTPIILQTFSLTFIAEWGDRSQIATIALAAAQNVYGVVAGSICGHGICSVMAVLSGRLLASFLSIRTVTFLGGILFIIFSVIPFI